MSQPENKKKIKLHLPVSFKHECNTKKKEDYMPIANVELVSIENDLRRQAMREQQGVEVGD